MTQDLNKIATHPLQTSYWAEFRRKWGNDVLETKYGIITTHKIPLSKYKIGIFEKGPAPTKDQLLELRELGKRHNLIFIKLEPNIEKIKVNKSVTQLISKYCVPGKTLFTPTTFWIDLTPSEEDLLKNFSGKTRYNIKVAQKHGVIVKEDNSEKAFRRYLELTEETASRQGFYAHSKKYHQLMWQTLHTEMVENGENPIARLMTAEFDGRIITTWILFTWKNFLYYPYGASSEQFKNVMANNLMMWEAIKLGKRLGLTTFDLWGREEGKGFTKFKEGYNPKVIEFLGTWDLVINKPIYHLYQRAEKIRWWLLRMKSKLT